LRARKLKQIFIIFTTNVWSKLLGLRKKVKSLNWGNLVKYFVHGTLISLLYTALASVFMGILSLLMIVAGGFLNAFITLRLWSTEIKADAWSLFWHGLILYILLAIVNFFFVFLPLSIVPRLETLTITLFVQAFIDGPICRKVAEHWEEEGEEVENIERKWREQRL